MYEGYVPTPEDMAELERIAQEASKEPLIDPDGERLERKLFILGHDLYPLRGTRHLYFEPESETVWWKSPRGWQETKVIEGKYGKYVRLSVDLQLIRELAGCA
jgi:hypothetical protein